MAAKQMAISFGIGAVLSGAFTKTFKTAGSIIEEVNKKTAELNQTRATLDKYKKLQITKQDTLSEILSANKELKSLKVNIQSVSDTGKTLNKTYETMQGEILQLEEKKKSLKNRLAQVSQEMKQNKGDNKNLKEEYKKLKTELGSVNTKLQDGKNNFSKLEKEITENNKETNSLNKQYTNLQNKMENLKKTQRRNNDEFQKVKKNLQEQNVSVKDTAKSYAELEKKVSSYNKALKLYEKSETVKNNATVVSGKGTSVLKTAGITTGIGAASLNSAIKAESAFADVKKQFDFETKEIEEQFKTDLQKLVTEKGIAISLEDLYGMAANAGQAGIKQDEAISYIEEAAKMAVGFGMDRGQASEYMFIWKNAFGMDIEKLKELTDQINILGNNTGATESKISEFITRLGNIPDIAGMGVNQTAALGASLIEMGMAPEVAATGAKRILSVMSKGDAAVKSEREALEIIGVDPVALAKLTQEDSEKALETVMLKISNLKKEDQSAALTLLFGEEGKVAASNIMKSYEKFRENLNLVKDPNTYKGSTDREYQNRADTTENKLQVFKTQFDILRADFGTALIPFLREGLTLITPFVQKLTSLMKENPEGFEKFIKTLVYGTGSLYTFGIGLKGISLGMNMYASYTKIAGKIVENQLLDKLVNSKKIFTGTGKYILNSGKLLFSGIGKIASAGITMFSNPIGMAILGITALVAIGYALYKNWDTIKLKAGELRAKIGDLIDRYWYILGPLGAVIKAGKSIYENWDTIKLKAGELKEKLIDMVANGINNFNEFKERATGILAIPFDFIMEKIESLKNAGKELKDYFLEIFEEIKNFSLTETIKNGASYLWNKGKETLLPGFANGGIVSSPTLAMVGEGNYSEAVIPLNNDSNSLNLWEKTGRLIGAYESQENNASSYNEFNFTYAPVVNAKNAEGVKEVLEKDARMSYEEFKSYFDKYQREVFRRGRSGR